MRRRLKVIVPVRPRGPVIFVPIFVLWLVTLSAAEAQTQTQGDVVDWRGLERGDIVVVPARSRSGTPGLRCLFLVSGDRESLFSRIRDPSFFKATYRNIEELRILRQFQNGEDIEFVLDAIVKKVRYTVARTIDPERYEVAWSRIAGDLRDISGLWAVRESPFPGKFLVIYESYVDPGGGIDVALYSTFARMQARPYLERLRTILEGHGG